MREVQIEKDKVGDIVQANREAHHEKYLEAIGAYRTHVVKTLRKRAQDIEDGRKDASDHYFELPEPEDHTEDYDLVLEMIAFETGDTITLTSTEFKQYVKDEWGWKRRFEQVSSTYLG